MKKTLIVSTTPEKKRYLMNVALEGILYNGREFEPKLDNLSLLINLVGEDFLKKKYKKKYKEIKAKIEELKVYVAELVSYYSDIKKGVVDKEDITSERFLKFQEYLSYAFTHLFFIDEITMYLARETDLKDLTVPSSYWDLASVSQKIVKEGERILMDEMELPPLEFEIGREEEKREEVIEEE